MSAAAGSAKPVVRALAWAYHVALDRLEWAVLGLCLAGVIFIGFVEILNRNLAWHLWNSELASRVSYALTYYTGLFGAALATRRLRHIRIDVVAPYVSPSTRRKLEIFGAIVGCVASAWLAVTAARYVVQAYGPDEHVFGYLSGWIWRVRTWRWPLVAGFALISLHFAVGAGERLAGAQPAAEAVTEMPGSGEGEP